MWRRNAVLWLFGVAAWAQSPSITTVITTGPRDTWFGPGSQVYIYGTFAPQSAAQDYGITVGGHAGAVLGVYNNLLISATIPIDAPTGSQTLMVTYKGQASNALPLTIAALAPEFAGGGATTLGDNKLPQFAAYNPFLHGVDNQPVTPVRAAAPGEGLGVTIYGVGPLAPPASMPTITVAGQNATVQQASGLNGRVSFSFTVPFSVPAGMQPVVATMGGVSTSTVLLPVGTAPAIASVVNSASFNASGAVAPGSIVSIFGASFGTKDNLSAYPSTSVSGVSVFFNGVAAPIFALSATGGQINVLAPSELGSSGTANLTVQTTVQGANVTSPAQTVRLAAAAPGIFFYSDPLVLARRNAVAVTANTAWIAMPLSMAAELQLPTNCSTLGAAALCGQPARPGDYLQIYATGLGKATPNGDPNGAVLPSGSVAPPDGKPVYQTVGTPTVTIGGLAATVLFSGLVPGNAGLYQVNVQIPAGVAAGDDVPLLVSMGGVSDSASIAIAAK
jgi:uncharacterized protein (TIGR03437 family)